MSKYTVRHFTNSNLRVRNAEFKNIKDAKDEMKRYDSYDSNDDSNSKLYSECGDVLAYRDWNKKRITWI